MEKDNYVTEDDTHVYCADCIYGDRLWESVIKMDKKLRPKQCKGCYYWYPEDSRAFSLRKNYVAKEQVNNGQDNPDIQG